VAVGGSPAAGVAVAVAAAEVVAAPGSHPASAIIDLACLLD
jgi:hypothetical protein